MQEINDWIVKEVGDDMPKIEKELNEMVPQPVRFPFVSEEEMTKRMESEIDMASLTSISSQIEVKNIDTAKLALSMALQSRKLKKSLDESRSEIIRPHLDYQRAINKLVKDWQARLASIEENLQKKIEVWMDEETSPFHEVNRIEVEDGTIYTNEFYTYEVTDEKLIEREYLSIDDEKINEAISMGMRSIPGIKIIKQKNTHMRVKN